MGRSGLHIRVGWDTYYEVDHFLATLSPRRQVRLTIYRVDRSDFLAIRLGARVVT